MVPHPPCNTNERKPWFILGEMHLLPFPVTASLAILYLSAGLEGDHRVKGGPAQQAQRSCGSKWEDEIVPGYSKTGALTFGSRVAKAAPRMH